MKLFGVGLTGKKKHLWQVNNNQYIFDDFSHKKHIFHQKLIYTTLLKLFPAGQTWYLLNIDWWHYWNNYVSNETIPKKIAISKIDTNDPTSNGTTATSNNQISTENNLRPASTVSSTNSIVEELTNSLTPKSSPHISRKNR